MIIKCQIFVYANPQCSNELRKINILSSNGHFEIRAVFISFQYDALKLRGICLHCIFGKPLNSDLSFGLKQAAYNI